MSAKEGVTVIIFYWTCFCTRIENTNTIHQNKSRLDIMYKIFVECRTTPSFPAPTNSPPPPPSQKYLNATLYDYVTVNCASVVNKLYILAILTAVALLYSSCFKSIAPTLYERSWTLYAVKAQTSLAPLSWFHGSRVTTAHTHQCCIFQSYAKTVPSRMKLIMKLTMREPTFMGSMTTDHVITACDVWL